VHPGSAPLRALTDFTREYGVYSAGEMAAGGAQIAGEVFIFSIYRLLCGALAYVSSSLI